MNEKTKHNCTNVSVESNKEKAEVMITAEIPAEKVAVHRKKAIEQLGKEVRVDGFREGKVPQEVLEKNVSEDQIMQRTAQIALAEELPLLLAAEKIPAIATPAVSITKLAPDNPIGFTARIPVMPEVKLADYKKVAKEAGGEAPSIEVTDEEVEETITHLRRERAKIDKIESGTEPTKAAEEAQQMQTLELPGIDDTFVQSLGYKDTSDFKTKLRENIKSEKGNREREKRRIAIVDALIEKSTIPVPEALANHELDKMEAQMKADIEQAGLTFDKYLEQAGKKREDIRQEWREAAEKRAKMQLLLAEVAQKENITADEKQLEQFVEQVKKQQPDVEEANARAYYEQALRNEAVLQWLEKQA